MTMIAAVGCGIDRNRRAEHVSSRQAAFEEDGFPEA